MKSTLITTLALTLMSVAALAGEENSKEKVSSWAYTCNLSFQASGTDFKIVVGPTLLRGTGVITCYDFLTGNTEKINVKVKAQGFGVGVEIAKVSISGGAIGIGLSTGPEGLLGHYGAVRADAAAGIGVGAAAAVRLSKGAINIDVSIQTQLGLGAGVDGLNVDLEQDGEKQIIRKQQELAVEPAPQPAPVAHTYASPQAMTATSGAPVQVHYVTENTPVVITDSKGKAIEILYLKHAQ